MNQETKIKEALEWIEFVLKNPQEVKSLRNARDLLKDALKGIHNETTPTP